MYEISIDASLNNIGLTVWREDEIVSAKLLRHNEKHSKKEKKGDIRIARIKENFEFVKEALDKYQPQIVYIESPTGSQDSSAMISYTFELALIAYIQTLSYKVCTVTPMQAKKSLTGNKNADKKEVMAAVREKYPYAPFPENSKGEWYAYCEHLCDSVAIYLAGIDKKN